MFSVRRSLGDPLSQTYWKWPVSDRVPDKDRDEVLLEAAIGTGSSYSAVQTGFHAAQARATSACASARAEPSGRLSLQALASPTSPKRAQIERTFRRTSVRPSPGAIESVRSAANCGDRWPNSLHACPRTGPSGNSRTHTAAASRQSPAFRKPTRKRKDNHWAQVHESRVSTDDPVGLSWTKP